MGEGGRLTTHLATGAMRFRVWPPIDRAQAGSQAEGGKREGGEGANTRVLVMGLQDTI